MRVLQVYKDYDPPVKGGIEGHINLLANGLVRRKVDVHVLVSNTCTSTETIREGAVPLTKAGQWGRFASAPLNPAFPLHLKRLSRGMDIVHFHYPNPTGEISALAAGLSPPLVVTYHSDIVRQKRLKMVYQPFMNLFFNRVQAIIATSPNYLNSSPVLCRYRQKCTVIPLGVDSGRAPALGPGTHDDGRTPEILFIGRFRYYKGLHVLIRAMGRVAGAKLVLVGRGPLERDLRRAVAEQGLSSKIEFLGELTHAELIRRIQLCSLLVLPSVERSEAFGIVLMEAMLCGKAVISTELGTGTSFVNQHGVTGLVVPPDEPPALAEAINYLTAHPRKCREMGVCARQRILGNFTADKMVARTHRLYRTVLKTVLKTESSKMES